MITKADDYPIHQLPHPVSEVGTERNFYDRYFFNGYSKENNVYFAAVLCLYPNLNIMDASFTLVDDGIQHNIRSSRILGLERLDTRVGPIEVKVVKPLEKLALELSENDSNIVAKLEFEKRFDPMQEPNMTLFNGPRKIMDTCRLTQHGNWSGEIEVKGKKIKINPDEFVGTRDRSWGVRPVGSGDSQPMVPFEMPQFYWLWAPVHFEDLATHIYYVDNEKGEANNSFAKIQYQDGKEQSNFVSHSKSVIYKPGTRRVKSLNLNLKTSEDELFKFEITPEINIFMCGLGYMHPDWGHGQFKGELAFHYDFYDLKDDPEDPPFLHVQSLCKVKLTCPQGKTSGRGVLEQLFLGPHEPSGFKDLFDKP